MRKRIYGALLALGMGGALIAFSPVAAEAACPTGSTCSGTATLSATLTGGQIGSRSIGTIATPAAFSSVIGTAGLTGSVVVPVVELTVAGTTPWTLTAQLAGTWSDGATPTPNTMPASSLADTANSTALVGTGGGTVTNGSPGASATLDAARTLMQDTGELTTALYTNTYTTTASLVLTPPNGTVATANTYTNTLDLTLIQ